MLEPRGAMIARGAVAAASVIAVIWTLGVAVAFSEAPRSDGLERPRLPGLPVVRPGGSQRHVGKPAARTQMADLVFRSSRRGMAPTDWTMRPSTST